MLRILYFMYWIVCVMSTNKKYEKEQIIDLPDKKKCIFCSGIASKIEWTALICSLNYSFGSSRVVDFCGYLQIRKVSLDELYNILSSNYMIKDLQLTCIDPICEYGEELRNNVKELLNNFVRNISTINDNKYNIPVKKKILAIFMTVLDSGYIINIMKSNKNYCDNMRILIEMFQPCIGYREMNRILNVLIANYPNLIPEKIFYKNIKYFLYDSCCDNTQKGYVVEKNITPKLIKYLDDDVSFIKLLKEIHNTNYIDIEFKTLIFKKIKNVYDDSIDKQLIHDNDKAARFLARVIECPKLDLESAV